ncbi:unnamed protein product [Linum trigynum]|uniref:Uncharacterized protein n=1 Tax=Linum trigynum TaxID=586398 RepID=A0AAV2EPG0_9ROSI
MVDSPSPTMNRVAGKWRGSMKARDAWPIRCRESRKGFRVRESERRKGVLLLVVGSWIGKAFAVVDDYQRRSGEGERRSSSPEKMGFLWISNPGKGRGK